MERRMLVVFVAVGLPIWAVGLAVAGPGDKVPIQSPAITRAQIEADWLHQDELRKPGTAPGRAVSNATREQDAAGGVDGVKDGKWGFHTENEKDPWWQVDLKQPVAIDRMVLYNRCELAERNNHIQVSVSDDGKSFRQVYRHNGKTFYGHTDKKPLGVPLAGVKARFVRLGLSGQSYFHLDEVEIYALGENKNIALGKPATQSSTSEWSARHDRVQTPEQLVAQPQQYQIGRAVERGLKLAACLREMGVKVEAEEQTLRQVGEQLKTLAKDAPQEARREVYLRAHWAVRKMALANPLLNFDSLLFVKRRPPEFPHMSDQHYGWWCRPGGGVFVLEGLKTESPRVRCLTADMPEGSFAGPDISYDGKKVVFAYCRYYPQTAAMAKVDKEKLPDGCFYNVYEMNVDGTSRRRLTNGRYDDFDPRYLPNGDILFLSTRKGTFLQCTKANSSSTLDGTLPDSYVRCGGGDTRPVAVFTLHAMDANGRNVRPLSAFENFEWTPSVAADGRILYARWDYIDRFNGPFISLWSANQDGTNPQLVYGNYTAKPQLVFEARSIPNSTRLVFTASAHHSNTGGSLVLLDRHYGTEFAQPLTRLTPEVCFPETEGWPEHYYANPYPLSESFHLVAWSDKRLPGHSFLPSEEQNPSKSMGVYLRDAFGNQELLYRDPAITSQYPIPIVARPKPPVQPSVVNWDGLQEGRFFVQDVYQGLEGIPRGTVKQLRIIAVPPKVQPNMNSPVLGVSAEDPGKFVLGLARVEEDGSAYFRVPSGMAVFFQALDEKGLAVQTMRSLTYVQPNQTLSCVGCHEHRDTTPRIARAPLAGLREPSRLIAGPAGSWPLRFDQLVQPVLDEQCVDCHRPGSKDAKAAKLDLTPAKAYDSLLNFGGGDLKRWAFERDRSVPGQCTAAHSKLYAVLTAPSGHEGVKLDPASLDRLTTWMDVYAHRQGSFSPGQEESLKKLRETWASLFVGGGKD